jgi:hypothetical protein
MPPTVAPIERQPTSGVGALAVNRTRRSCTSRGRADRPRVPMSLLRPSRGSPTPGATEQHGLALALVEPADKFAGGGSWLGSLASVCAVSQHQAATSLEAKPTSAAEPQTRVGTRSALFGRLVISWEWPGLPRPTLSPGRSSAGTAAMPPSPGSGSAEGTGARPSPVLLFSRSRSQSPSPAWDPMGPCSGRPGLPISISGRIAPLREREPPSEWEHAATKVTPAKEGGRRCHRSGRRRIRRQSSLARRASRSRRRRRRAGSNRGRSQPVASPVWAATSSISARLTDETIGLQNRPIRSATEFLNPTRSPCREGTLTTAGSANRRFGLTTPPSICFQSRHHRPPTLVLVSEHVADAVRAGLVERTSRDCLRIDAAIERKELSAPAGRERHR